MAFADNKILVDCKVTRVVDANVFEESLSVEEYPGFTIASVDGSLQVKVGVNRNYEEIKGDLIRILPSVGFGKSFEFQYADSTENFIFNTTGASRKNTGKLFVRGIKEKQHRLVATFACK